MESTTQHFGVPQLQADYVKTLLLHEPDQILAKTQYVCCIESGFIVTWRGFVQIDVKQRVQKHGFGGAALSRWQPTEIYEQSKSEVKTTVG